MSKPGAVIDPGDERRYSASSLLAIPLSRPEKLPTDNTSYSIFKYEKCMKYIFNIYHNYVQEIKPLRKPKLPCVGDISNRLQLVIEN